ncbi:MAG TPA: hypothetical protein GX506_08805 [Firmicutes bacterium]|nr:hypothetical protein [Bacillota bacterium]
MLLYFFGILKAADSVIVNNLQRIDKVQEPVRAAGDDIELYVAPADEIEAQYVAGMVANLIESGVEPQEIAVLSRTSFQFPLLDRNFTRLGIPHVVVGYTGLLGRAIVKDILAYLRFAVNPEDVTALERALTAERGNGIGKKTVEKIVRLAGGGPFDRALRAICDGDIEAVPKFRLTPKVRASLEKFLKLINVIKTLPPSDAVSMVVDSVKLKVEL